MILTVLYWASVSVLNVKKGIFWMIRRCAERRYKIVFKFLHKEFAKNVKIFMS